MSHIRHAYPEEEAWVNECYREIGFLPSDFTRELVAVAEQRACRAALGRLVPINAHCAELGGIYVLPCFRALGLASEMVAYLTHQGSSYERIFCLPFAHLVQLYTRAGFRPWDTADDLPQEIERKHQWCNAHYQESTLLLLRP